MNKSVRLNIYDRIHIEAKASFGRMGNGICSSISNYSETVFDGAWAPTYSETLNVTIGPFDRKGVW